MSLVSDTAPSARQIEEALTVALGRSGIPLKVRLYRMYGEARSAGLELSDPETDEIRFTMDMDVNRPVQPTQLYEVAGLRFRGISPVQMLADKVSALSTDRVFRRIKDFVDIYYLSQVFELDRSSLMRALNDSGRLLGRFDSFLGRPEELRHAYDRFRFNGGAGKPPFESVYSAVKAYLKEVLPDPGSSK